MLFSGFGFFVAFWNYNHFDNYMASRLFKLYKPRAERKIENGRNFMHSEYMRPRIGYNPKEYCKDLVPSCLWNLCKKSCRTNRLERGFEKARDKMMKEINILEIIKSRRYFNAAFKILLTKS